MEEEQLLKKYHESKRDYHKFIFQKYSSEFYQNLNDKGKIHYIGCEIKDINNLEEEEELKKLYKILCKKYHPDRNKNSKKSNNKMQIINELYKNKDLIGLKEFEDNPNPNKYLLKELIKDSEKYTNSLVVQWKLYPDNRHYIESNYLTESEFKLYMYLKDENEKLKSINIELNSIKEILNKNES